MDSSGSVGSKNFETVKSFIKNISDHFIIGPSDTRFGVIHYSSNPVLDFTPRDPRYVPLFLSNKFLVLKLQCRTDNILQLQ